MSDLHPLTSSSSDAKAERAFPTTAVGIAVAAVLLLTALLVLLGRRHAAPEGQGGAYAANLQLGDVQMSESESLSGGKSTYIDGRMANHGPLTVTGVTVKVQFPNDSGAPPQIMTVPLQLIRTRQPYVDTEPVSAAPVPPGGGAEFRLIFEGVNDAWNQQTPTIQVTRVSTR